ncbi:hypothetical protein EDB80DRAFT_516630, partial [Ilyonectria destructans]
YTAVHAHPSGPGDAHPTVLQILTGKVILITGCSSGIDIKTAYTLLKMGVRLYITIYNKEKVKSILGDLFE